MPTLFLWGPRANSRPAPRYDAWGYYNEPMPEPLRPDLRIRAAANLDVRGPRLRPGLEPSSPVWGRLRRRANGWGWGRTWRLPLRSARRLLGHVMRPGVDERQPLMAFGILLFGPSPGLVEAPLHHAWAEGGRTAAFRPRRHTATRGPRSWRLAIPDARQLPRRFIAALAVRQLGALRARTPRPRGLGAPRPLQGPGFRGGLTPPSTTAGAYPREVIPYGGGAHSDLQLIEVWQRTWSVGLLLRPRRWARHLRF